MTNLLLKALRCEPIERPPVWLMRQAGRYMPEYRALRGKYSLWQLFHEPELAAQVTKQPLDVLGVDAAILFSDILVIAEVFGLVVDFSQQGGPRIVPAVHTPSQVQALQMRPVQEVLSYVFETIRRVKQEIVQPLIGFSGAPFTVASYLIDSTSKEAFSRTKRWLKEDPTSFHALLKKITQATIIYLQEQVKAGVDALQIFDSWASVLDEAEFTQFSLPYLQEIVRVVQTKEMPVIVFCRDASLRAEALAGIQSAAISFDWHRSMKELRKIVPASIAIQGNFPPSFLKSSKGEIQSGVQELLSSMQGERGWIVNLGHGITPDISVDHVRCFVDAAKCFSL